MVHVGMRRGEGSGSAGAVRLGDRRNDIEVKVIDVEGRLTWMEIYG